MGDFVTTIASRCSSIMDVQDTALLMVPDLIIHGIGHP